MGASLLAVAKSIYYFLASLGAQDNADNAHILDINVVIN